MTVPHSKKADFDDLIPVAEKSLKKIFFCLECRRLLLLLTNVFYIGLERKGSSLRILNSFIHPRSCGISISG
jgi:hypothetical protein